MIINIVSGWPSDILTFLALPFSKSSYTNLPLHHLKFFFRTLRNGSRIWRVLGESLWYRAFRTKDLYLFILKSKQGLVSDVLGTVWAKLPLIEVTFSLAIVLMDLEMKLLCTLPQTERPFSDCVLFRFLFDRFLCRRNRVIAITHESRIGKEAGVWVRWCLTVK